MAAIITSPPVIVGTPTQMGRAGNHQPLNIFNYELHSPDRQYQVLSSQYPVAGQFVLEVYKSLDGGATWVSQDISNRPALDNIPQMVAPTVSIRNNIIAIIYAPADQLGLRGIYFDCSTDSFSAPSLSGPITHLSEASVLQLPSNGDCYVFYTKGAPLVLFYRTFIAGVWGAEVQISFEAANVILINVIIDPDERLHIYYHTITSTFDLREVTILANVVGAASDVNLGISVGDALTVGQPSIIGTNIVIPYIQTLLNGNDFTSVIVGGPYSNPVWANPLVVDTLPTVTVNGSDITTRSVVSKDGLTVFVFWIALDYSNISAVIDQMWYVSNNNGGVGAWSAPILYYDAVANPELEDPTVTPINQDLHTLSVIVLDDGNFAVCTALEENGFCAGYYLVNLPCSFTITPTIRFPSGVGGERYNPVNIIGSEVGGPPSQSVSYTILDTNSNVAPALPLGMVIGKRATQGAPITNTSLTGPLVSNNVIGAVLGSFASSGGVIAPGGGGSGGNFYNTLPPLPSNIPVTYRGKVRLIA